ncbi:MAG: T9SS type A sorting domain-containing protein [candidate division KSB1 bacterium]|nr:T9SS type A sorting domain-containing protein [candidate division KSB1 bacterium]
MMKCLYNHVFLIVAVLLLWLSNDSLIAQSAAATRVIQFAGCDWLVKSGYWGPGPNHFSDSDSSVWVDAQGRLHLRIRQEGTIWYCAEVYTTQFTRYGEHRFLVEGRIDLLDRNIVLGLFVYSSDASEIDIEFSRWGNPNYAKVGSFTVQPWETSGNVERFICHLDSAKSTHYFNWQPDSITFGSMHGHYLGEPPSANHYIHRWTYRGNDNPKAANQLRTHINYWLNRGDRPLDIRTLEVIITQVTQPLSEGAGPTVTPPIKFNLLRNYPNPFSDATTIEYWLQHPASVRVEVFNLAGQRVALFTNSTGVSYKNQLEFHAEHLPPGIYFYRVQSEQFSATNKMTLTR